MITRESPLDLAKWARGEADRRALWDINGMTTGCDPFISKLRIIADCLESLDKEKTRLHHLDKCTDLCFYNEEGDPDVGVFSHWVASQDSTVHGKRMSRMMGCAGTLMCLADDLMMECNKNHDDQVVETEIVVPSPLES